MADPFELKRDGLGQLPTHEVCAGELQRQQTGLLLIKSIALRFE